MKFKVQPDFTIERSLKTQVIGIDEAGRGPLAGPVVAAAIVLDEEAISLGINDSKKLSPKKREALYEILTKKYKTVVSIIEPAEIDSINILKATMLAMKLCIEKMNLPDHSIIIDGNQTPFVAHNISCVVGGDAKSLSIAAASIIAKVERDRLMDKLSRDYPMYNWVKNKGYGTKEHIKNLREFGPSPHHRKTFIKNFFY